MSKDQTPLKDFALPRRDVLRELQAQFEFAGPLDRELLASFNEASQRAIETGNIADIQTHIFNDESRSHADLVKKAFNHRVTTMRREQPVILFDVPSIELQKGAPVTRLELKAAFLAATAELPDLTQRVMDEETKEELYPIIRVNQYNGEGEGTIELFYESLYELTEPADGNKPCVGFAFMYSEHFADVFQRELNQFLFDYKGLVTGIYLASQTASNEIAKDHASPWLSKVGFGQLDSLNEDRILGLIMKFEHVLDPEDDQTVRYLVAEYGSGKTYALRALQAKNLPGATFLIEQRPLSEQEEVLRGKVIFVDEAVARTEKELAQIREAAEKNDGVVILLVPNNEVKAEIQGKYNPIV